MYIHIYIYIYIGIICPQEHMYCPNWRPKIKKCANVFYISSIFEDNETVFQSAWPIVAEWRHTLGYLFRHNRHNPWLTRHPCTPWLLNLVALVGRQQSCANWSASPSYATGLTSVPCTGSLAAVFAWTFTQSFKWCTTWAQLNMFQNVLTHLGCNLFNYGDFV